MTQEERIAVFLDYENLAIGAREGLGGMAFDFKPVADALAERGRVVVRKGYADWSAFDEDRRMLTRHHVELIEIPQRLGANRKNAADIKMAVDALELAFERDYVTTFVICTGDSDFTPLVHKLRELDRRVIGVGLRGSTSALLPPACDEFLFYENLEGVEVPSRSRRSRRRSSGSKDSAASATPEESGTVQDKSLDDLAVVVAQTLAGLQQNNDVVAASTLKRALLRKDPTFSESDYGFRAFGELLRHLQDNSVVELSEGPAKGDPEVSFPEKGDDEAQAYALLTSVLDDGGAPLSGLKTRMRKKQPAFSERRLGFRSFLQFVRAAETRGVVELDWDEENDDYVVKVGGDGG